MARSLSRFASPRWRSAGVGTSAAPDLNESGDTQPDFPVFGGGDDADPRTLGRRMRNLVDQTGEAVEPEMDEVIRRLENGEDPEKIEDRMSDTFPDPAPGGDNSLYDG